MSSADLGRLGSQAEDGGSSAVGVSMFIDISFFSCGQATFSDGLRYACSMRRGERAAPFLVIKELFTLLRINPAARSLRGSFGSSVLAWGWASAGSSRRRSRASALAVGSCALAFEERIQAS